MALIIKSDQVTGSDFAPGVLQKLLLEKEKTGQERLQIKQFEFTEKIQFDFKTEEDSLSWLMPLSSNLKYNGLDLGKNSLLILPPNFTLKIEGRIGEKLIICSVLQIQRFVKNNDQIPLNIKCVDWSVEPVLLSEFDSRKRIYLASPVLWDGLDCVKGEMIYYPKGGTAPPHYHTGAGDIIYSFEDETHWFENYISDSFVFAEFFVPGNYKTIWENPEKVCTWLPTGKDISGRPAARNIAKHVAGQGKDV
jgi:hypothetical protein